MIETVTLTIQSNAEGSWYCAHAATTDAASFCALPSLGRPPPEEITR